MVRDGQLQGRDEERGGKDSEEKNISFDKQNSLMILWYTEKGFSDKSPRM